MFKRLKDLVEYIGAWLIVVIFHAIILYCRGYEIVKEVYYIMFRIPYYKQMDKYHTYVKRIDR
jgi:hypothetical protein